MAAEQADQPPARSARKQPALVANVKRIDAATRKPIGAHRARVRASARPAPRRRRVTGAAASASSRGRRARTRDALRARRGAAARAGCGCRRRPSRPSPRDPTPAARRSATRAAAARRRRTQKRVSVPKKPGAAGPRRAPPRRTASATSPSRPAARQRRARRHPRPPGVHVATQPPSVDRPAVEPVAKAGLEDLERRRVPAVPAQQRQHAAVGLADVEGVLGLELVEMIWLKGERISTTSWTSTRPRQTPRRPARADGRPSTQQRRGRVPVADRHALVDRRRDDLAEAALRWPC